MKTAFKFGFLALTLTISLTSCDFFSNRHEKNPIDSPKIDSTATDSTKKTNFTVDSLKNSADSSKKQ